MKTAVDLTIPPAGFPEPVKRVRRAPTFANDLYELTKPRMNFLVLVTTMVGFFMAIRPGQWSWILIPTLIGTALTAASAAIFNQVVEWEHDKLMPRTRLRPLPTGRIDRRFAIAYGTILGLLGIGCLAWLVNTLTAGLGLFTLLSYVLVYTPMKRTTSLNTVVGAIPGAIPPVMGWTAAHGSLSPEAAALFCILFFWQMPHFLAIAIMYRQDYAAGGFKMLPVVDKNLSMTGRQIVIYGLCLIPITLMPTMLFHMTGEVYLVAAFLLGLGYLSFGVICANTGQRPDARRLFFASITYLPLLLGVMMLDKR